MLGIIPGLLLGIPEWHKVGAVVLSLLWAIGVVVLRPAYLGEGTLSTLMVVFGGGIGLGGSVWFFGSVTG